MIGYSAAGVQCALPQSHGKDRLRVVLDGVRSFCKQGDPSVRTKRRHKLCRKQCVKNNDPREPASPVCQSALTTEVLPSLVAGKLPQNRAYFAFLLSSAKVPRHSSFLFVYSELEHPAGRSILRRGDW